MSLNCNKANHMWKWEGLVFKEDDIPELEVDIDELLELSDCEQRLKLQVVKIIYLDNYSYK